MRLLLASTSPRRRELLSLLQVPFEPVEPTFDERPATALSAEQRAVFSAVGKARSCCARYPDALILGGDTVVTVDDRVLGKPADRAEARATLWRLRDRDHLVLSAVALLGQDNRIEQVGVESVRVRMRGFTARELDAYLDTGEYVDKAGGYAIQGEGSRLITGIEGDFTAAVGLPLRLVATLLASGGVPVPVDVNTLYREKPYPNWDRFGAALSSTRAPDRLL